VSGFKGHDAKGGPKLGAGVAAGPTGLQRRVEEARARDREAELARREIAQQGQLVGRVLGPDAEREFVRRAEAELTPAASGPRYVLEGRGKNGAPDLVTGPFYEDGPDAADAPNSKSITEERAGGEQGTGGGGGGVKRASLQSTGKKSGPKGGRPRAYEGEPWVAEGVSRRTWERRRARSMKENKGGGDGGRG
jgi:hypothetical protein